MRVEHTPGPWFALGERTDIQICCDEGGDYRIAFMATDCRLADARLIAAAPELLEALKDARAFLGPFCEDDDREWERELAAQIDAAIAKATGGAQ